MKKDLLCFMGGVALLLVVWQIGVGLVGQPELFPSIGMMGDRLVSLLRDITFYQSLLSSGLRWMAGMLLSFGLAVPIAWLFTRFKSLEMLFLPLFSLMRSIPVISFILIALILMNGESIPLLIAFLTMFPILLMALQAGFSSIDPHAREMASLFQMGRANRFLHIFYEQIHVTLVAGLQQAGSLGWRAILMGEVLSQCRLGIGSQMKQAQTFIDMLDLLVWTLAAVMLGFVFDRLLRYLLNRKVPVVYAPASVADDITYGRENFNISARQLWGEYSGESFTSVLKSGTIYGLSAPSGVGKTSLLRMLLSLQPAKSGSVEIDLSRGVAYVSHETTLVSWLTVSENVALVLARHFSAEEARGKARDALKKLNLYELKDRYPHALSNGERQRVAIARALVFPSPYLLMDEPFKGLDKELTYQIIEDIRNDQMKKRQLILFTTHQMDELLGLADIRLSMNGDQEILPTEITLPGVKIYKTNA